MDKMPLPTAPMAPLLSSGIPVGSQWGYQNKMVVDGSIMWRSNRTSRHMHLLNDYHSELEERRRARLGKLVQQVGSPHLKPLRATYTSIFHFPPVVRSNRYSI